MDTVDQVTGYAMLAMIAGSIGVISAYVARLALNILKDMRR